MYNKSLYKIYPNNGQLPDLFPDAIRNSINDFTAIVAPVGIDCDGTDLNRTWFIVAKTSSGLFSCRANTAITPTN